ncbi:zinc finger MYM-type protein 1-like [Chenopodium quinoa]|uniref:zinc finger MYM-type protein 1-like n=1 Tax=Chenopodium quinoa TaxID=63459 RepID=UPI000B775E89|nr:zinc finger MYM-type protein 1-like [Chenopodium quinoa]
MGDSFEVEEEEEEEELAYDVELLPHDPGLRMDIMDYPPNQRNPHEVENNCGGDAFVNGGFRAWNKPERFDKHVGGVNSAHNIAYEKYIQKDIITCCAKEITRRIVEEVGDEYFAILADESSDVSQKEQLALVLRFVDRKSGAVMERFLGIVHVGDTTALSLKNAIISILMEHNLSPSMIRGQGYDGASNMKGEINGLKTLIMNDTPRAYYIHCFAHQLQLTLVAVAKKMIIVVGCLKLLQTC